MINNYFKDCKNKAEAKALYRQHAKVLHPDKGGNKADFEELTRQHEAFVTPSRAKAQNFAYNATDHGHLNDAFRKAYEEHRQHFTRSSRFGSAFEQGQQSYGKPGGFNLPFDHPAIIEIANLKKTNEQYFIALKQARAEIHMYKMNLDNETHRRIEIEQILRETTKTNLQLYNENEVLTRTNLMLNEALAAAKPWYVRLKEWIGGLRE